MDYLKDAQMLARQMDGNIPNEVGARNAQRATACALIAIAQELRVMNEQSNTMLEAEDIAPFKIADFDLGQPGTEKDLF